MSSPKDVLSTIHSILQFPSTSIYVLDNPLSFSACTYIYSLSIHHTKMIFTSLFLFSFPLATSMNLNPQHVFSNPDQPSSQRWHFPTVHESAIQARRILNRSSIATFSTVFPSTASTFENRPSDVGGAPMALTDYYASCGPQPYNPTILAVSIATTLKNARAGSNVTLSLRYEPPADHPPSDDPYLYSPANLPRFSLIGHIQPLSVSEVTDNNIKACFLKTHPDAQIWSPGNDIHESWWGKLVVEEFYWFGGFGDRAYIGWIPIEEWRGVTEEEVANARLVGEEDCTMQEDKYILQGNSEPEQCGPKCKREKAFQAKGPGW